MTLNKHKPKNGKANARRIIAGMPEAIDKIKRARDAGNTDNNSHHSGDGDSVHAGRSFRR